MKENQLIKAVEFNVVLNKNFKFTGIEKLIESNDKKIVMKQNSTIITLTGEKLIVEKVCSDEKEVIGSGIINQIKIGGANAKESLIHKLLKWYN